MWTAADFNNTRWVNRVYQAFYVAKHGDDRNDGHPQRPVASLARAAILAKAAAQPLLFMGYNFSPVVCGSGVYSEQVNLTSILVMGDGFVTLDGAGAPKLTEANHWGCQDITIQNYVSLMGTFVYVHAQNCIFRNMNYLGEGYLAFFGTNCLLDNFPRVNSGSYGGMHLEAANCTFISSIFNYTADAIITNSYIDGTTRIGSGSAVINAYNSNIQGKLNDMTLADFQLATSNSAVNCVSVAAGFNNQANGDYTLATTSQMRNLASDGGYAGAYGIGINFSGLADAQTITNVRFDAGLGAFVLDSPTQKGSVEFNVKDFQRNWILKEALLVGEEDNIDNQTIDATISYDLDGFGLPADVQSGGLQPLTTYWNNGYDVVTYAGQNYSNGQYFCVISDLTYTTIGVGKVVRLTEAPNIRLYEMKYSTISAVDCVSRPWQYFVFNRVPTIDAAGRSNGDVLFNPATANPVTVRYMKLRLTLMPNSLA